MFNLFVGLDFYDRENPPNQLEARKALLLEQTNQHRPGENHDHDEDKGQQNGRGSDQQDRGDKTYDRIQFHISYSLKHALEMTHRK